MKLWEYEDSNNSNWSNHAHECYPIAVSIPGIIYLGFSFNIKVSLKTSRFLSKPATFTLFLFTYINCLTSFVPIEIGECQLEMTMSYSNHLTSFVSIEIGDISPFLRLFYSCSPLVLLNISQFN